MGKQVKVNSPRQAARPRFFRALRWQLTIRTLLPLGLLVVTFGIVGQIGYTEVTESLTTSQNAELAKVEAARLSDYLLDTTRALQQFANSSEMISTKPDQIFNNSRNDLISQQFDLVQVSDP